MSALYAIAGTLFAAGAVLAAIRLVRGPSALDRAIALDVLMSVVVGGVVLTAAVADSADTLVIAVVIALLGFLGTTGLVKLLPEDKQ